MAQVKSLSCQIFLVSVERFYYRVADFLEESTVNAEQNADVQERLTPELEKFIQHWKKQPGNLIMVLQGSVVTIWVSSGSETLKVPEVVGKPEEVAKDILTDAGLSFTSLPKVTSNPAEVGKVVDQVPLPGAKVEPGYNVRIFIGQAP